MAFATKAHSSFDLNGDVVSSVKPDTQLIYRSVQVNARALINIVRVSVFRPMALMKYSAGQLL